MNGSIHIGRRLAGLALIVGAMATLVPVAQTSSGFTRSPDAIDRALAAEQAQKIAAIDARERALLTRPDLGSVAAPLDAFERALQNRPNPRLSRHALQYFLANDARQQSLTAHPVGSVHPTVSSTGFDWDDFGLGAGAGIGFMLVLVGFATLALRRSHKGMTTA